MDDQAEDFELIERVKTCDEDALKWLWEKYRRHAYGTARGILRNEADAEEAESETFVKVKMKSHNFGRRPSLQAWIMEIAKNTAIDMLRKRQRHPEEELDEGIPNRELNRESLINLRRAIQNLPDNFRIALEYREVYGYTQEEIAERMGQSVSTVNNWIHHAKERLKEELGGSS